jgi:hypothetical protein
VDVVDCAGDLGELESGGLLGDALGLPRVGRKGAVIGEGDDKDKGVSLFVVQDFDDRHAVRMVDPLHDRNFARQPLDGRD